MLNNFFRIMKNVLVPAFLCIMFLLCTTFLTACAKQSNSKMIFEALKEYNIIDDDDLEFEDYTKKETSTSMSVSSSTWYVYETSSKTYHITFSEKNGKYCAFLFLSDTSDYLYYWYYVFEKDGKNSLKKIDGYADVITSSHDDKYGLSSFSANQDKIALTFDMESAEDAESPIIDYWNTYKETDALPDIEVSLDDETVEPTDVKIVYNENSDSISVKINIDADSFIIMDYVKIGDMCWHTAPSD